MFLKPRFVCGLLEKSLFPVPRSWNTALNTSPKGKSFHELIRASSRLLCFLLNHRIYIFKFMCCMLDGLPISSIKQVKESDRSIFLVLFPKKSRSHLQLHFVFSMTFNDPQHFKGMTPALSLDLKSECSTLFSPIGKWNSKIQLNISFLCLQNQLPTWSLLLPGMIPVLFPLPRLEVGVGSS